MLKVDISNIWGEVSLPDLLNLEKEIFDAHQLLTAEAGPPARTLALTLPREEELERILTAAQRIRADSEVVVVIGSGCSGSRAVTELLQGCHRNAFRGDGDPAILFAGDCLSSRSLTELQQLLEGKDFSLVILCQADATPEAALTARSLRWMLERKYGTDEARYRTCIVAAAEMEDQKKTAGEEGWELFTVPTGVTGPYAALTAAGLLPMAAAGIDIGRVVQGAWAAWQEYDLRSFENPLWLYVAVRCLMQRQGKAMELLCCGEPCFGAFGSWWQQLFAAAEGKNRKGLFPAAVQLPRDLQGLGQLMARGNRSFFETMVHFDPPGLPQNIMPDYRDPDGLNCLSDKTLDDVGRLLCLGAAEVHADAGISVVSMDCGVPDEEKAGELLCFFQLAGALSAAVAGVDPFGREAEALYRQALLSLAGVPEKGQ